METIPNKEQKLPMVEACVFETQKRMWMFVFKYMFQDGRLKCVPFQYKSSGAKKKMRFLVDVSSKENVVFAFQKFLENENKLDSEVISKLMTEKNITEGLIAHYKSMGLDEKAQKLQEAWRKKIYDRKKNRRGFVRKTSTAKKVFGKGNRFADRGTENRGEKVSSVLAKS
jgi:hypothetical protein